MRIDGLQLKLKHKHLIDEFIRNGGNGAKAWRTVYAAECRHYTNANTPAQAFYVYTRRPRIKAYLERKLQRMVRKAEITEDRVLTQLQDAYDMARRQGKPGEMISAANAQAKLVGLLRDRVEAGPPGGFADLENISDVLEKLAEAIGDDAALQIGKALGVLPAGGEVAPELVVSSSERSDQAAEAVEQTIALLATDSPSGSLN